MKIAVLPRGGPLMRLRGELLVKEGDPEGCSADDHSLTFSRNTMDPPRLPCQRSIAVGERAGQGPTF
jgi:hypothetical protein